MRSLAALSTDRQELVIVMVNPTSKTILYTADLSKVSPLGNRIDVYRTTENEDCLLIENEISLHGTKPEISLSPKSVTTILIPLTMH